MIRRTRFTGLLRDGSAAGLVGGLPARAIRNRLVAGASTRIFRRRRARIHRAMPAPFGRFLETLGYPYQREVDNPAYRRFLTPGA